jgi:SH3 domain protein
MRITLNINSDNVNDCILRKIPPLLLFMKNPFDFSYHWREDDWNSGKSIAEIFSRMKFSQFFTMKPHINKLCFLLLTALAISTNSFAATQKYITDEFEVTMRSGTSTANEILRMLKSGEAVTILEEDVDTKYSLVEAEGGKKGYVLNHYLVDSPSSKFQLEQLQVKSTNQQETNALLESQIENLQTELGIERSDNGSLRATLQASEDELSRIKDAAENTLNIVNENEELRGRVGQLTKINSMLSDENASLKDSSNIDWFVRGAGVSLIAFLLGILITRIRWRKRDSWGSY